MVEGWVSASREDPSDTIGVVDDQIEAIASLIDPGTGFAVVTDAVIFSDAFATYRVISYDTTNDLAQIYQLAAGRLARNDTEVAINADDLYTDREDQVQIGETIDIPLLGLKVVGHFRGFSSVATYQATSIPAEVLANTTSYTVRVLTDDGSIAWDENSEPENPHPNVLGSKTGRNDLSFVEGGFEYLRLGIVSSMLGLLVASALGAAAMGTGVYRRLREFGIVAAAGADNQQLRRVVGFESLFVSAFGAVIGVTIGWAATIINSRWFWVPLEGLAAALIGLATAVLTAARAATLLRRTSVTQALAGRVPPPPIRRIRERTSLAVVLLVILIGIPAFARALPHDEVATTIGSFFVFAIGSVSAIFFVPALANLSRQIPRLPTAPRLVARDVGRHQSRTATAVLILTAATCIAALTTLFGSQQNRWYGLAAAFIIVLGVLVIVTSVGASEKEEDLRTMRALGGDPHLRRRFAAGSALLIGLLGTTWGLLMAVGFVVSWEPWLRTTDVAWGPTALFAYAIPVVAAAILAVALRPDYELPLPRK
jgi:hypothetical protein